MSGTVWCLVHSPSVCVTEGTDPGLTPRSATQLLRGYTNSLSSLGLMVLVCKMGTIKSASPTWHAEWAVCEKLLTKPENKAPQSRNQESQLPQVLVRVLFRAQESRLSAPTYRNS
jgi:hypothetical protein